MLPAPLTTTITCPVSDIHSDKATTITDKKKGCIPYPNKPYIHPRSCNVENKLKTAPGSSQMVPNTSHPLPPPPRTMTNNKIVSRMNSVNSVSQKVKVWQEIAKSPGRNISIVKVIDRGLAISSRKRTRRAGTISEKQLLNQEPKPAGKEEEDRQEESRRNQQAAVDNKGRSKKTSPEKVKEASSIRQHFSQLNSPRTKCLKRLKPVRKTPSKPEKTLPHSKQARPQRKIASMIARWENLSENVLTLAVNGSPELESETDSQSGEVLLEEIQLDAKLGKAAILSQRTNQEPWKKKLVIS